MAIFYKFRQKGGKNMKLKAVAKWLLIAGGLNWGLTALGLNVVDAIASALGLPVVATVVYILVGLSAVYQIFGKK